MTDAPSTAPDDVEALAAWCDQFASGDELSPRFRQIAVTLRALSKALVEARRDRDNAAHFLNKTALREKAEFERAQAAEQRLANALRERDESDAAHAWNAYISTTMDHVPLPPPGGYERWVNEAVARHARSQEKP